VEVHIFKEAILCIFHKHQAHHRRKKRIFAHNETFMVTRRIKALVPVAGIGVQLRPHTHTQPKPLIPVAGKPILGHIIDSMIEAGVQEVVFVVGYLSEKIIQYVEKQYHGRIEYQFVVQEPRRGVAHAVWVARHAIADADEVVINLGDVIFGDEVTRILAQPGNVLGVHPVEDPRKYGIARCDAEGNILSLSEKPQIPTSNQALVGLYKIRDIGGLTQALDELAALPSDTNPNLSLTDALMRMIANGFGIQALRVENWFDCGSKDSLLSAHHILLERVQERPDYQFPGTVIIHPVHIGEGCRIEQSIIGPFVAIAEHTEVINSVVYHSIIGAYSRLETIILGESVVGNDTSLRGKAHSINIGDNTEIDFDQ
jgi:glucose-1-phosphate thymidylyltransferase